MKLKKSTYDAFELYLKISNVINLSGFSMKRAVKLHELADRAYYRYKRRLSAWERSDYIVEPALVIDFEPAEKSLF
ncbi:hypothetical protein [Methylobacter sp.]|uniref:hypothetical protein n=1 Tax=Methylobacter sp. TaxID=2051955 RepID=UPI00121309EC|nr:hypothetical protein [Methylobacter sp.]TAK60468.1 MAG: hypothetical protein EPO18_17185 [Methylobacter sp.]